MATFEGVIPSLDPIIGGKRVAFDGPKIDVFDPSTGDVIAQITDVGTEGVDQAVASSLEGFKVWRRKTYRERADALSAFAEALVARREELGALEALEVGKPVSAGVAEVFGSADRIRFFAYGARHMSVPNSGNFRDGLTSFARRSPLGVVGCIVPWNYPLALLVWKIGPALAAGNAVVVKPAEETPIVTSLVAEIAQEFLPPGVFNLVMGNGPTVGNALVTHPKVPMISMTGETSTGKIIYANAAPEMKKLHLELGGPSAVIVFDDADLDLFEATLPQGTFRNSGQDCHALSRIFAHESIKDRVVEACVRVAEKQTLGGAFDEETVIGPLVSKQQQERVARLVDEAAALPHVTVVTGGKVPDRPGYFYPATVLDGVRHDDPIKRTEIFGPVITVTSFQTEEEVLGWVNEQEHGLSGGVWTRSLDRGLRVAEELEAGTVWVNDHSKTVTEMPFGGWKHSGVGRELSTEAIIEHTEAKHIALDTTRR